MKYYAIKGFNKTAKADFMGQTLEVSLSWIEGQIGSMPIFDNYEKATIYAKKHGYEIILFETTEKDNKCITK